MVNESSDHTPEIRTQHIGDADLPYLLYTGEGPPLLFLHATGFNPWLWHPLARDLADSYRILAPSFCDHRVADPEQGGLNWATLAEDTLRLCDMLHLERPFLVGHSMGATVLMIANALHELPAAGMVLIEPILLPAEFYRGPMRVDEHPLAARAIKRTNFWRDRNDAMQYLRSRTLFQRWDEEMLELYVNHGMTARNAEGLQLACSPQREAALFMGGRQFDPWPLLPRISCPVLIVDGEKSENGNLIDIDRIQSLIPDCKRRTVKDAGHLIPMERPREMARIIGEFFRSLRPEGRGKTGGDPHRQETERVCRTAPTIESDDLLCRTLLDTADEIIFLKDESSRYLIVNRALLDFFARSEAEVLGRTTDELMPAETAAVCRATDERALATGRVVIAEQTIGERIYETRKFPIALSGNRTGIVGYVKNITDRKRNEEALRESENRYRELAEMLPQVVFELDLGGYFTFFNRHSLELFGYVAEDMKSLNVFQCIAPEDRERAWRNFQLVLRGESHRDNEYTVLRKDGSRFPVIIYAVGIIRDGRPVGMRGLLVDITERKQAEERLRDLSNRDHLTGLYNRAFFQAELDRLEVGRRFPVSIVMADVDRLKEINDTEGHQAGDDRLRRTAEVLGTFRSEDVVARIGGDEFAVILPNTDAATAEAVVQRVQESLANHNGRHPEKPLGLSFGVATGEKGVSLMEILKRADERMYRYKTGIRPEGGDPFGSQGKRAPC